MLLPAQVWDLGMQLAELAAAADERAQRGRPLPQRPRQNQGHAQARPCLHLVF